MKKGLILILNACIAAITLTTLRYYLVTESVFGSDLHISEHNGSDFGNQSQLALQIKQDSVNYPELYNQKFHEKQSLKKLLNSDCCDDF